MTDNRKTRRAKNAGPAGELNRQLRDAWKRERGALVNPSQKPRGPVQ